MQPRLQGLAGPRIADGRRGVRARREGLPPGETALVEGMHDVAHGLIGTAAAASTPGRRLARGTGPKYLAAAYGTGGRGPPTGLERSPLVRRERAHTYGCWHIPA